MNARRVFSLALIIVASSIPHAAFAAADSVPRYQLHAGEQLLFHCDRSEQRPGADEPASQRRLDWKINVIAQNADGSWRILALADSGGTVQTANGGTMQYERILEAGEYDLYPDGVIKGDIDPVINLECLFPRLPADRGQIDAGWEDHASDHARSATFHVASATQPAMFAFTCDLSGGIQGVFQPGARLTYQFNSQVGAIDRIDINAGKTGSPYSEQGKVERTAVKTLDAATLKTISGFADGFGEARTAYRQAVAGNLPLTALADAQSKLDKAANDFRLGMQADGVPPAPAAPPSALAILLGAAKPPSNDFTISAMAPDSPTPKHILDSPAPDWTALDLDAKSHSMKDYRGQVVLLDFGFRTCPWCIRETPDIIRLHDDFKKQPVTILGMDIDTDPADVKFVRDTMQIPYPMLLAAGVAGAYPLEGCPTVVIVDKNGIMRNRFVGYDTTGYDQMKAAIQSLLDEKPPAK